MRIEPRWTFTDVRHAAIAFGRELERRRPGEVTTKWWKEERGESVFVDYNQNARDRTIASAYSVRPKPGAPVSAPVTWDELTEVEPEDFTVATMPARFAEVGDPHEAIDDVAHSLEPLLELYEAQGHGDMPYPPDYPKMPGEPKRVQPSRDRDRKQDAVSATAGSTASTSLPVFSPRNSLSSTSGNVVDVALHDVLARSQLARRQPPAELRDRLASSGRRSRTRRSPVIEARFTSSCM